MKTERKIEIVGGVSVALILVARHFITKYKDTLKYWGYLRSREDKFKNKFLSYKLKSLFATGEKKIMLQKEAERYRRKAEWFSKKLNKINDKSYEK